MNKEPWEIKIGILISYDAELVFTAIPLIYKEATKIVLAIDKERVTWSGSFFTLASDFFIRIKEIDIDSKIEIFEDSFYNENSTSIESETRERQLLANYMGVGGWHIQLDVDEYFADFPGFISTLHNFEEKDLGKINVTADWLTLFKRNASGFFFVNGGDERVPIATNSPNYDYARNIFAEGYNELRIHTPVIHDSWARSEEEIKLKLNNWGHNSDFDTHEYFNFWLSVTQSNFRYIRDFHPLNPISWPRLGFLSGDIHDFIKFTKSNVNYTNQYEWIPCSSTKDISVFHRNKNFFIKLLKLITPPLLMIIGKKICKIFGSIK